MNYNIHITSNFRRLPTSSSLGASALRIVQLGSFGFTSLYLHSVALIRSNAQSLPKSNERSRLQWLGEYIRDIVLGGDELEPVDPIFKEVSNVHPIHGQPNKLRLVPCTCTRA